MRNGGQVKAQKVIVGTNGVLDGANGLVDSTVLVMKGGSMRPGNSPGVMEINGDLTVSGRLEIESFSLDDFFRQKSVFGDVFGISDLSVFDNATLYLSAAGNYTELGYDLTTGALQTSAAPVPASVWLFGSGLLGLFGVARGKTKSN